MEELIVTPNKRNVQFKPETLIRRIPSRRELTSEDKDELWYHRLEKEAMLQGALKTAADLEPTDDQARGLEHYTCEGGSNQQHARYRQYSRVLGEQTRQHQQQQQQQQSSGPNDNKITNGDELIGDISSTCSKRSREEAILRAAKDAVAAGVARADDERTQTSNNEGIFGGIRQTFRHFGWLEPLTEK